MPWKGQPQEIPGKWKSLIRGNPSYREVIYTRGAPRKYKGKSLAKGNQLYKEASYIYIYIYIYGKSCKANALFNKRAHPRPSLFEESSVHLNISTTIGKTKETKTTKEVKATTIKTIEKTTITKNNTTFRPMSAKVDMGLRALLFYLSCRFSRWFLIVFALTSLVVLVSLVFPMVVENFALYV